MGKVCIGIDYDSHAVHMFQVAFPLSPTSPGIPMRLHSTGKLDEDFKQLLGVFQNMALNAATFQDELFILVEAPMYIQNAKTAFKLHQAFTLIVLACSLAKIRYDKVEVTKWKKTVMKNARAKKEEVITDMRLMFGEVITDTHFADAAAIALTGLKMMEDESCQESSVMSKIVSISENSKSLTSLAGIEENPTIGSDT